MKKITIITLIAICFSSSAMAQYYDHHRIDSLNTELQKCSDDTNKVDILNTIAYAYATSIDDTIKVANYLQQSFPLAEKLGYKKGIASVYVVKGVVSCQMGRYDDALAKYAIALKLRNEANAGTVLINRVIYDIAFVYARQRKYKKALSTFKTVINSFDDTAHDELIARTFFMIGHIYKSEHKYKKASKYYTNAFIISIKNNDKLGVLNYYLLEARLNTEHHKYQKALELANKGLKLSKEIGYQSGIDKANKYIGVLKAMTL